MLLTITTTHQPATELGYLLHKNPGRAQSFDLSFGRAHVFYPEASDERCTAALLLDVDPVGLVRGRSPRGGALDQYVNDRPYVASSFLSVALSQVFGTALGGRSRERGELVDTPLPLIARLSALPCRGGAAVLQRLFEPLGYQVTAQRHPLDAAFPEWGESNYFSVELAHTIRLRELLSHLYVLVPALDGEKHYYVGDDEVDKLFRHGEQWLSAHPECELIVRRYLKHRHHLTRLALGRLLEEDNQNADEAAEKNEAQEEVIEQRVSLNRHRLNAVLEALKAAGARRVVDLGCGEGRLLRELARERQFTELVGVDVSHRSLQIAHERLKIDWLPEMQRERIKLWQGSLNYRDRRLSGFDAATVVEVIEHLDAPRLSAFARVLFEFARPALVVMTTPNVEYNVKFDGLPSGQLRHRDHRFEWTRAEFQAWAEAAAAQYGYAVEFGNIGEVDELVGAPTQMALFHLIRSQPSNLPTAST